MGLIGKFIAGVGVAAVTGVVAGKKIIDKKIEKNKKKKELEQDIAVTQDEQKMLPSSENKNHKFCVHCGTKLDINAKFCSGCGTSLEDKAGTGSKESVENSSQEQKCPRCGAPIDGSQMQCAYCDYEFEVVEKVKAVDELTKKLDEIESRRVKGIFKNNDNEIIKQKVSLIIGFPISNSKEEIFDFLLLSSSMQEMDEHEGIIEAWTLKYQQAYEKATLLFATDKMFLDYQERNKKKIKYWLK